VDDVEKDHSDMKTAVAEKEVSVAQALLIATALFAVSMALIFGMFIGIYLNPILHRVDNTTEVAACNAKANAGVWQAIADSLDVPPAPATARTLAVEQIRDKAKMFDRCH
jgi:hypothetical protein